MIQQFSCSVCHKSIGDKENSVFCDSCKLWVHIKCNNLTYVDYQYLSVFTNIFGTQRFSLTMYKPHEFHESDLDHNL